MQPDAAAIPIKPLRNANSRKGQSTAAGSTTRTQPEPGCAGLAGRTAECDYLLYARIGAPGFDNVRRFWRRREAAELKREKTWRNLVRAASSKPTKVFGRKRGVSLHQLSTLETHSSRGIKLLNAPIFAYIISGMEMSPEELGREIECDVNNCLAAMSERGGVELVFLMNG